MGAGAKLNYANYAVPWYWAEESSTPGSVALGTDARAFGAEAVAIGKLSRAGFHSMAIGDETVAQHYSLAMGNASSASNWATAIGGGTHAEAPGAVAIGSSAFARGEYALAVGASAVGDGYYAAGVGGRAFGRSSWAGAWGWSEAQDSITLGGNAYGIKSFAVHSGVTWAPHSVAIGRGAVAAQDYQVALGTLNVFEQRSLPNNQPDTAPRNSDPIFAIGNGHPVNEGLPNYSEVRSNAFTVSYEGGAWVQGGLTVEGTALVRDAQNNFVETPAPSVFKGDVSVQGVLRVPESGDLSMGAFNAGTPP